MIDKDFTFYKVTNVMWDFDDGDEEEIASLPTSFDVALLKTTDEDEVVDAICDLISEETGWCVENFDCEIVDKFD